MSKDKNQITIMFTCIGRRVSLLNAFRRAAEQLGLACRCVAAERTPFSSAFQLCDARYLVKPVVDPDYIHQILDAAKKESADLLVPTVDLDLHLLADYKQAFIDIGCVPLVSSPDVVSICQDKRKAYAFLTENGFSTPQTIEYDKITSTCPIPYPCFLKPWDGYASRGNFVAADREELDFYGRRVPNCIVQRFVEGDEYTCDVFVDFDMQVRCVVPRRRIEVRSGEVSKGQVVRHRKIMDEVARLVTELKAGPGVITVQSILDQQDKVQIIEINPRFGGGAPLAIQAGADFPYWIIQQLLGQKSAIEFDGFTDKLTMLRYDAEVWYEGGQT